MMKKISMAVVALALLVGFSAPVQAATASKTTHTSTKLVASKKKHHHKKKAAPKKHKKLSHTKHKHTTTSTKSKPGSKL